MVVRVEKNKAKGVICMKSWRTVLILGLLSFGALACKSNDSSGGGGGGAPATPDPKCDQKTSSSTCSDANCSWTGTRCGGSYSYCSKFSNVNACPGNYCQWSESSSSCQPFPQSASPTDVCSQYSPEMCVQVAGCSYNGSACVSGSNGGATTGATSGATTGVTTGVTTGNSPTPAPNGECSSYSVVTCFVRQGCKVAYLPWPPKCVSR